MNNLHLDIFKIAQKFVKTLLPTFKEVSDEYYAYQYGPCPYANNQVIIYPVKLETLTPYNRAKKFLDEASADNLITIKVDLGRNLFEFSLEANLSILYRDSNERIITYNIPARFLLLSLKDAKKEFKEAIVTKQKLMKEDLKTLIEEYKKQKELKENPRYAEYLQLKAKYERKENDIN